MVLNTNNDATKHDVHSVKSGHIVCWSLQNTVQRFFERVRFRWRHEQTRSKYWTIVSDYIGDVNDINTVQWYSWFDCKSTKIRKVCIRKNKWMWGQVHSKKYWSWKIDVILEELVYVKENWAVKKSIMMTCEDVLQSRKIQNRHGVDNGRKEDIRNKSYNKETMVSIHKMMTKLRKKTNRWQVIEN